MKTNILFAVVASFMPLLAASDSYAPLEHHTFTHDCVLREYFVHVPVGRAEALPVVLAIHGYIVVYPQSSHFVDTNSSGAYRITSWNTLGDRVPSPDAGPKCIADAVKYPCPPECGACDRCRWATCNDDFGYFEKLLDLVSSSYKTDSERYYVLGMSNGGMMTLGLGCSLSDRFAAIAPIDAQLPAGFDCGPETRLPMIHLSGGRDNTVRPDGKPSGDGHVYVSATDMAATWAHALQCESGPNDWATDASKKAGLSCTSHSASANHERSMARTGGWT